MGIKVGQISLSLRRHNLMVQSQNGLYMTIVKNREKELGFGL